MESALRVLAFRWKRYQFEDLPFSRIFYLFFQHNLKNSIFVQYNLKNLLLYPTRLKLQSVASRQQLKHSLVHFPMIYFIDRPQSMVCPFKDLICLER